MENDIRLQCYEDRGPRVQKCHIRPPIKSNPTMGFEPKIRYISDTLYWYVE